MRRQSLLKTASKQSLRILSRKAVYESHLILGGFFMFVLWEKWQESKKCMEKSRTQLEESETNHVESRTWLGKSGKYIYK